MATRENIERAALLVRLQMHCTEPYLMYQLAFFAKLIEQAGLRAHGRLGRTYFEGGAEELKATGAYECMHFCRECGKAFMVRFDDNLVAAFLDAWRRERWFDDLMLCKKCGGPLALPDDE